MTVFRSGASLPAWCELEHFEIIELAPARARAVPRRARKERVLVTSGYCQAAIGARSQVIRQGQFLDLAAGEAGWEFRSREISCQLVLLLGRWGEELGGCGLFSAEANPPSAVRGDPVDYPKNTSIDSHYHDCDEYWLILAGAGTVVVGGRQFRVTAGDGIAIGMGHHHDLQEVQAPVKAVYFETTLEGQKRIGHLWSHTHGAAEPKLERV
jgi:mannose-6-phosphate isomerase-like protein (cupin superfamily)